VTTYSGDAKDEIAAAAFERACCPATFLLSLARYSSATIRVRHNALPQFTAIVNERASVARASLRAARYARIEMHASALQPHSGARGRRLVAIVTRRPFTSAVPRLKRLCCRRAWLRGAFLACGSVADPHRSYHLEFVCPDDRAARTLAQVLGSLHVDAGVVRRRRRPVVCVKGAAAVVDVLGQLGANRAVLAFDDVLALRATKNAIRRKVNSEAANAARAALSAARQREVAMSLNAHARLTSLTSTLREAVDLRLAHPEATLAELARAARPQITKPAMAARMRTLAGIARRRGSSQSRASSRGGRRTVPKRLL